MPLALACARRGLWRVRQRVENVYGSVVNRGCLRAGLPLPLALACMWRGLWRVRQRVQQGV